MIDIPVVLVLGAGASLPYEFPLGQTLVDEAISNSSDLKPILKELDDTLEIQLDEFLAELRSAHPDSIDAFLEARHPQFTMIGKAVIAYHLMQKEDVSNLENVSRDVDWYQHFLYKMLLGSKGFDELVFSDVAILTYNYDRSLEYALFKMLKGLGHSESDCQKALGTLNICHLHGQIGYLKELNPDSYRPYDTKVDVGRLNQARNGIRVVHEPVENDPVFREAHTYLRNAKHVIFLGFGFLDKNIERLKLDENRMNNTSYWGTGVGVTTWEAQNYARLFPKNRSGEGPLGLTIDTSIKSVKDYLREYGYLFVE